MGRTIWTTTIRHAPSGKTRVISGSDKFIVEEKARAQQQSWERAWQLAESRRQAREDEQLAKQEAQRARKEASERAKEEAVAYKQRRHDEAAEKTQDAQDTLDALHGLLGHTLAVDDVVDWSALKHLEPFSESPPEAPKAPKLEMRPIMRPPERSDPEFNRPPNEPPGLQQKPRRPRFIDKQFQPRLGILKKLITSAQERERLARAACEAALPEWTQLCAQIEQHNLELLTQEHQRHQALMQQIFDDALRGWQEHEAETTALNAQRQAAHAKATQAANQQWKRDCLEYQERKSASEQARVQHNHQVETHQRNYEALEPGAVFDYFDLVLNASSYPEGIPREWDMEYQPESRMLVLDYRLPSPTDMPRVKEVRYVASKDELKDIPLSVSEANALYDEVLYQIALRTLHELFEADYADSLDAAVFNGIVHSVDKATGKDVRACVLSLQAGKDGFMAINLAQVEPKACFRSLKGLSSSQLHSLAPVAPILRLDTSDTRFVDAYGVADDLHEGTNLASMDWEDFEHLVREVFEKEFSATGGEVKVTRASRDGGVDAIAFDPDPIRGGKIVIQAKRYSNTVGVSAVRDLYGTVMNEGATKGILVSTANYGPDAYEFANGKPLTLLNGANLLHLLAKHGHKARIDLQAARMR